MAQIAIALSMLLQAASPAAAAPATQVAQAEPTKAKPANDPNQVVCKRQLRAGTLADYEKICRTKADWKRNADNQRDAWGDLQGTKGSTHGG